MPHRQPNRWILCALVQLCCLLPGMALAESFSLREPFGDERTFRVKAIVSGNGQIQTPTQDGKNLEMPLQFQANTNFTERVLPAGGRDDRAWRSLRYYDEAKSDIKVKNQVTNLRLSSLVREVVCEGDRKGLIYYSRDMPMRRHDLDLMTIPADPLALQAILPAEEIEAGDSWTIPDWAAQMLVGMEAATKLQMKGTLAEVNGKLATLKISGEVSGAITGAAATIQVEGTVQFDLQARYMTSARWIQKEKRSVSTVSPGMDVTVTVEWVRGPETAATISNARLAEIPLDPPPISKLLLFDSQYWKASLIHDRHWYVFQEIPEVAVLRLVENGALISQCNIARIGKAEPGQHVSPEKFESDIRASLGDQFESIVDRQETDSASGNYILRISAAGKANELAMIWIYYLCAAEDGRQISFVFAVEGSHVEDLQGRDLSMVESLEFKPE